MSRLTSSARFAAGTDLAAYERARSLGMAVQVSAQSWHGLASTEDDRYRIAATADGGIWLFRTPFPDRCAPVAP